jgi:predicted Zn-dependent peptidase
MTITPLRISNAQSVSPCSLITAHNVGVLNVQRCKTHTFPNGFTLIYEKPTNNSPLSSLQLFCDVGSVNEYDGIRGASHFIEHMCFKGTKKFPQSKDILVAFDEFGADFNAYTEKRMTCYHIKCNKEHINNCIQLVSDMLLNSIFDKTEYKKEYEVVIEENIRNENDHDVIVDENLDMLLYKGSSYEFHIDNIHFHNKPLKYNDVLEYYKNFYIPNRFVLSIVSNISFDKIISFVKKSYFIKNDRGNANSPTITNNEFILRHSINLNITPQTEIQYNLHKKVGIVTNVLSIGFRTCNDLCSDKYALTLLDTMFNGLSGKLSILLRENNGLTYTSSSSVNFYEHIGDFVISAETDSKKLLKNGNKKGVLPLIIGLLNDLIKNGVSNKEVEMAKKMKQEKMNINKEDNYNLAEHNGREMLLYGNADNIISYTHLFDSCYKDLNKTQINNVITKYFKPENMSICIVGEHIPSLSIIKTECEKL